MSPNNILYSCGAAALILLIKSIVVHNTATLTNVPSHGSPGLKCSDDIPQHLLSNI